jgi:hypothetical protein
MKTLIKNDINMALATQNIENSGHYYPNMTLRIRGDCLKVIDHNKFFTAYLKLSNISIGTHMITIPMMIYDEISLKPHLEYRYINL